MRLFVVGVFSLYLAVFLYVLWICVRQVQVAWSASRARESEFRTIGILLLDIQEEIQTGFAVSDQAWDRLAQQKHWIAKLAHASLISLRKSGAEILPSLRRFVDLTNFSEECRVLADGKSAQARSQAWICAGLIPVEAIAVYTLFPEGLKSWSLWGTGFIVAFGLCASAGYWVHGLAGKASRGGLRASEAQWPIQGLACGEELLALIRAGTPGDLAWSQAVDRLLVYEPSWVEHWSPQLWADSGEEKAKVKGVGLRFETLRLGPRLQSAIFRSVAEGMGVVERIEGALGAFRIQMRGEMEAQLQRLPSVCLLPLFSLVLPATLGFLAWSLYLGFGQEISFSDF